MLKRKTTTEIKVYDKGIDGRNPMSDIPCLDEVLILAQLFRPKCKHNENIHAVWVKPFYMEEPTSEYSSVFGDMEWAKVLEYNTSKYPGYSVLWVPRQLIDFDPACDLLYALTTLNKLYYGDIIFPNTSKFDSELKYLPVYYRINDNAYLSSLYTDREFEYISEYIGVVIDKILSTSSFAYQTPSSPDAGINVSISIRMEKIFGTLFMNAYKMEWNKSKIIKYLGMSEFLYKKILSKTPSKYEIRANGKNSFIKSEWFGESAVIDVSTEVEYHATEDIHYVSFNIGFSYKEMMNLSNKKREQEENQDINIELDDSVCARCGDKTSDYIKEYTELELNLVCQVLYAITGSNIFNSTSTTRKGEVISKDNISKRELLECIVTSEHLRKSESPIIFTLNKSTTLEDIKRTVKMCTDPVVELFKSFGTEISLKYQQMTDNDFWIFVVKKSMRED